MKNAEYELAGNIHPLLLGKEVETTDDKGVVTKKRVPYTINTREAESLDEMHMLVDQANPDNVRKLAQSAWDIIVQRVIRNAASSETVKAILDGSTEVDVNGEKLDFSHDTEEDRIAFALKFCQDAADGYTYGARQPGTGGVAKVTKEKAAKMDAIGAAAAADPELAAKLAALGITL